MARLNTRITSLFGIRHPIILPGMSWISKPELVAAVSNAGGLGILATGPLSAEETEKSIRRIRELTKAPFGIGATLMMPGAKENAEVALREKVPVINFSLGKADWLCEQAHAYGGKVIATVTTEKHARSAKEVGADALLVTGHEAAAHGGDVTSLVLIPAIASRVDLPIIAAGGFANGQGLLAALSLGADGIAMGSRLAVSRESTLHEAVKSAVVAKREGDTIYSKNIDGLYARVMKTPAAAKAAKKPTNMFIAAFQAMGQARRFNMNPLKILPGLLVEYDKIYMLSQFGAATEKLEKATIHGDLDSGIQFIGQSQGLINDVATVDEILTRVVKEALEAQAKNAARIVQ